jgi:hypothetical protein
LGQLKAFEISDGSVEILGQAASKSEKQIPHPAQTAGIRDDKVVRNGAWTREVNRAISDFREKAAVRVGRAIFLWCELRGWNSTRESILDESEMP